MFFEARPRMVMGWWSQPVLLMVPCYLDVTSKAAVVEFGKGKGSWVKGKRRGRAKCCASVLKKIDSELKGETDD